MKEQIVYTNPARSEYSYEIGRKPYNPELMRFVHNELCDCMRAAYPAVKGLRYVEDMVEHHPNGNDYSYRQAVIVVFENGYRKIANVEGDSNLGAVKDVMKAIER